MADNTADQTGEMPKATGKTDMEGSPSKSGVPVPKPQKSTVQGILRAAKVKLGATKVPPPGTRMSVLGLPVDFGVTGSREGLSYDDEDDEPQVPQSFKFTDLDYDYEDRDDDEPDYDDYDDIDEEGEGVEAYEGEADDLFDPSGQLADLLAEQSEGEGPPITEDIALVANKVWSTVQKDLTKVYRQHPRPENMNNFRVDMNEEALQLPNFTKWGKRRDMRLRAAQGAVAGVASIAAANLQSLASLEAADTQQTIKLLTKLVTGTMDSLKLLSHASMTVNNVRKEMMKQFINPKYHSVCKPTKTVDSKLLFGDDFATRLKALDKTIKIGKTTSFSSGGYRNRRYHPYGQNGGRNRNFLGKSQLTTHVQAIRNRSFMDTHFDLPNITQQNRFDSKFNTDALIVCRPRPGPQRSGQRVPEEQPELNPEQVDTLVGKLPGIDINKWPVYQAGRASMCLDEWKKLTSDRIILKHVKGLVIDFVNVPQQTKPPRPIHLSHKERQYLQKELKTLLDMNIIEKTQHSEGEFISNIFLRPKKQPGKYRLILNLKDLNYEVEYHHFKMDTLETALKLVSPGCFMISIDIKDAYYTLRIHEAFRKYLRFEVDGQLYQFTCLPNGLASGPRLWTKVLKVPLAYLREHYDINTAAYIDDLLVTHDSIKQCHMAARTMVQLLQNLGFTISPKSILKPTQIIEHVGFVINSINMKVYLPPEKIQNISEYIQHCMKQKTLSIREVAQLLGKLEATKPGNRFASLYTKTLTWEKNAALAWNAYDFDKTMKLSQQVIKELKWWLHNLPTVYADIFVKQPDQTIFTDASQAGWGCHAPFCHRKFGGRWNLEEQQYHINVLELLAILYSLKAVCRSLHDIHLRVMTDNTTAMLCINNQGSVHSSECNNVVRQIWTWAIDRNIWLSAAHIPGEQNTVADTASRKFADDSEWELNDTIFQQICAEFGQPNIDLFASRLNRKVEQFCSWHPDPEAKFIDAFTIDWSKFFGYAFPPFAVLPAMMQKIRMEGAQVIVVVPKWPTKPWFTIMKNMIVGQMVEIPVTDDTLFLSSSLKENRRTTHTRGQQKRHPLVGQLTLMVGRLSGKPL